MSCAPAWRSWTASTRCPARPRSRRRARRSARTRLRRRRRGAADERGHRLHAEAALPAAHAGRGSRAASCCPPATAWSSSPPTPTSSARRSIEFDGNGRMYVGEMISYMMDAERQPRARSDQPHQPLGEHEGRRPLRQAHRVRRQPRRAAHDPAARRTASSSRARPTPTTSSSDRHQRRRRRRQARGRLHRHRPERRRQHRAPEGRACSGTWTTGSTPPTTRSASAGRRTGFLREPTGAERRPVGPRVGRRREAVVRGCGRRARADELPVPDSLRRVHAVPGAGRGGRGRRRRPPPPRARIRTARRAWRTASRRTSPSSGRRRASATCRAASAARACRRRT